jgi:hypothetical protein
MARVSLPKMTLTLEDGRDVDAVFRPEDEDAVTTALKHHGTIKLRIQGRGIFLANGTLQKVAEITEITLLQTHDNAPSMSDVPIWKAFEQIMSRVSPDKIESLPSDGASQHDYYVHGAPKRT